MVGRSRARYLAPLALAATVVGTYLVVHAGLTESHSEQSSHVAKRATGSHRTHPRAKFYVVQPGDSLTSIATKTGLSLARLESLNPSVDPNSLQTNQRLRLRR